MIFLQNSAFVSKIMDNDRRENRGGLVYSHTYPHTWNIVHGLIGLDRLRLRNSCILVFSVLYLAILKILICAKDRFETELVHYVMLNLIGQKKLIFSQEKVTCILIFVQGFICTSNTNLLNILFENICCTLCSCSSSQNPINESLPVCLCGRCARRRGNRKHERVVNLEL